MASEAAAPLGSRVPEDAEAGVSAELATAEPFAGAAGVAAGRSPPPASSFPPGVPVPLAAADALDEAAVDFAVPELVAGLLALRRRFLAPDPVAAVFARSEVADASVLLSSSGVLPSLSVPSPDCGVVGRAKLPAPLVASTRSERLSTET